MQSREDYIKRVSPSTLVSDWSVDVYSSIFIVNKRQVSTSLGYQWSQWTSGCGQPLPLLPILAAVHRILRGIVVCTTQGEIAVRLYL
jgi:hypothetical protein